jgi:hypothetical protein
VCGVPIGPMRPPRWLAILVQTRRSVGLCICSTSGTSVGRPRRLREAAMGCMWTHVACREAPRFLRVRSAKDADHMRFKCNSRWGLLWWRTSLVVVRRKVLAAYQRMSGRPPQLPPPPPASYKFEPFSRFAFWSTPDSQSRGSQKCIEWVYRLIKGNTRQASVGLLLNATTATT